MILRSPLHHPRIVLVSVILLQTMLIFVAGSALNKQVHETWFEPEDSHPPRGGKLINFTTNYWVFMAYLCYIPLMRWDSVEQYQMGGCNAPLSGFDRLGTFSWWPFSPKISSAPVTWVVFVFTWRNDVTCFCSYSLVLGACCGSHGTWYGAWTVVGVENRRVSFVVVWFRSLCCRSTRWSFWKILQ